MQSHSPVVALVFPFLNGWLLWFGLAAAIPILIHLWNRRKHREIAWAAMEYLLAAMRRKSRRITIEQLILLAMRVLILLMLALALADPFLRDRPIFGSNFAAGGDTHWVLVVDGSYSMDYQHRGQRRFDAAKRLASELLDESTQGDGFTLVLMGEPPQVLIREPAFSRDDIREEISNLPLLHAGGNLAATLAEVETIVDKAQSKHSRLKKTRVCIFTDMGGTTWDDVVSSDCRDRAATIAERAKLLVFDVGQRADENIAVTRLEASESLVTTSRDIVFRAEIENFGSYPRDQQKVEFLVDGRNVFEDRVNVAAGGKATSSLVHRFTVPGEHNVEVRVEDNVLDVDNHRWLSVPVRDAIRVLCIEGKNGSARHVALALEPGNAIRRRVQTTIASENALLESTLSQFDAVFLCNVGRFNGNEAKALFEFVREGGGIVFFLGDQVQAENYNRELGAPMNEYRVLPAHIDSLAPKKQHAFDPRDYDHPIVKPFRDHTKSGLLTTPVRRYFKLTPYAASANKVALWFDSGDPAIIEEKIHSGRTILYAIAASDASVDRSSNPPTPWTQIHKWPSFPPLIQETLALAVSGRSSVRNLQVGDEIEGVLHNTVEDIPLTIDQPDGKTERIETSVVGNDLRWAYVGGQQSGLYRAQFGAPVSRSETFVLNVNTRESNLARFDVELLPSQFQLGYEAGDAEVADAADPERWQVFQLVLAALLMLLFVETFLAWRFGRAAN